MTHEMKWSIISHLEHAKCQRQSPEDTSGKTVYLSDEEIDELLELLRVSN